MALSNILTVLHNDHVRTWIFVASVATQVAADTENYDQSDEHEKDNQQRDPPERPQSRLICTDTERTCQHTCQSNGIITQ